MWSLLAQAAVASPGDWLGAGVLAARFTSLYADLAKAVRQETGEAVRYWWGCGQSAINFLREALEVPGFNEGNRRRHGAVLQLPAINVGRRKGRGESW